ncbi:MAG: riboflavin synthase [Betaproteobacteria bacterium]|nr:riboflavin synthase [Betaproteobacteria bacterium]
MFTGIITAVGEIGEIAPAGGGVRMQIGAPPGWLNAAKIGGSIAVDGACLTAAEICGDSFFADVSAETVKCCAPWRTGAAVNLEHPLAAGEKIGGHFVSGHVSAAARLLRGQKTQDGGRRMTFLPPPELLKYIVRKGSAALAGVSLTVAEVAGAEFSAQIVPHTLAATTLGRLPEGAAVNLETDILAAYVEKLAAAGGVL